MIVPFDPFIVTSYAVICSRAALPAAAWYFPFYLYFVFALAERKNEIQKQGKVPLRMTIFGHRVTGVIVCMSHLEYNTVAAATNKSLCITGMVISNSDESLLLLPISRKALAA